MRRMNVPWFITFIFWICYLRVFFKQGWRIHIHAAPTHWWATLTAPTNTWATLTAPTHRWATLTTPTHRWATLTAPTHRWATLTTPTHLWATFTAPTHRWTTLTAPTHRCATLTVPTHRWSTLTAPTHRWATLTAPTHRWATLTAPTHRWATLTGANISVHRTRLARFRCCCRILRGDKLMFIPEEYLKWKYIAMLFKIWTIYNYRDSITVCRYQFWISTLTHFQWIEQRFCSWHSAFKYVGEIYKKI